jgi:hypothetical protein
MHTAEFLDAVTEGRGVLHEELRRLGTMSGDELEEVRREALRRLVEGTLTPALAIAVLPMAGVEPLVPDLVGLLRSAATPLPVRAAAMTLLRYTTFDVRHEVASFDPETFLELVGQAMEMETAARTVAQKGTPFEHLAAADPEEDDVDIDDLIDEVLESFYASPEAAAAADPEDLGWVDSFVRHGVVYGFGSPAGWGAGAIDEILNDILPRKVTISSAAEAAGAVPAFRTFCRWASRVAPVPEARAIDIVLDELEDDFPSMMMDPQRFGPAKSFVVSGTAAGYDMSSEEGVLAFQEHWNRQHALPREAAKRTKAEAAKKRKAKMAKLSRKKNRRKK